MSNVLRFENETLLQKYLKEQGVNLQRSIGFGSEGNCYISSKNLDAYKMLDEFRKEEYKIDDIITTKDIDLESFAFPKTLLVIDDELKGYTSKLIKNNIFKSINYDDKFLQNLNYDNLIKAYYKMQKDINKLSEEQISIFDLTFNLLFDDKNLTGIDTCLYNRVEEKPFEHNQECLDYSIICELKMMTDDNIYDITTKTDVEKYIKEIKKEYRRK